MAISKIQRTYVVYFLFPSIIHKDAISRPPMKTIIGLTARGIVWDEAAGEIAWDSETFPFSPRDRDEGITQTEARQLFHPSKKKLPETQVWLVLLARFRQRWILFCKLSNLSLLAEVNRLCTSPIKHHQQGAGCHASGQERLITTSASPGQTILHNFNHQRSSHHGSARVICVPQSMSLPVGNSCPPNVLIGGRKSSFA